MSRNSSDNFDNNVSSESLEQELENNADNLEFQPDPNAPSTYHTSFNALGSTGSNSSDLFTKEALEHYSESHERPEDLESTTMGHMATTGLGSEDTTVTGAMTGPAGASPSQETLSTFGETEGSANPVDTGKGKSKKAKKKSKSDGNGNGTPGNPSGKNGKKPKKFSLSLVVMILLLVIGVGLICYPSISDIWNRHVSSRAVAAYVEATEDLTPQKREAELAKARAYNEELVGQGNSRFLPDEEENKRYNSILDVTGTGIMGYVAIPKIHVRVPIYHGTSDTVLQIAAGHLEGTSFPIGGKGTHAAVSGHTGLPSALLFTGLDQLEKGDRFTVTVFDNVLTYEVNAIHVVEPTNVKNLAIDPDKDLMSLITCTPYGVNSHRLIVTGKRVPTPKPSDHAVVRDQALARDIGLTTFVIVAVALAVLAIVLINRRHARKMRAAHHSGQGK